MSFGGGSFRTKATFAPLPATARGHPTQLDYDPSGKSANFLYTNGRSVYIRNIDDPRIAVEYVGHSSQATVARYSPSGFYIASADVQGNVRIWDATQPDQILKTETRALSGRINDLSWDFESKRIIAAGEGKERFGHAFLFDSASSVGEIIGHSKVINAITTNKSRPFRAATCSDDMTVNFYHGVPYKFNKTIKDHSRFVQCVRFSPSGDHFASAGMDGKMFLYDGKTGDKISEITSGEGGHTGGILSFSWSPDGKQILSCSGDTTAKIWDVTASSVVSTFNFGQGGIDDQQVGSLWTNNHLLTVSLSGEINYIDKQGGGRPIKTIKGHQKAITSLTVAENSGTFYTGSYDGRILSWADSGAEEVAGSGHTNQVRGLASNSSKVYSIGMDDTLRSIDAGAKSFTPHVVATEGVPNALSVRGPYSAFVTGSGRVTLLKDGALAFSKSFSWTPTAVDISPDTKTVVVGDEDRKLHVFSFDGQQITEVTTLENNRGQITALAFSPDGSLLASADRERSILVFDTASWTVKITQWMFHTARVHSISWSPDGLHAVSGSLDTNVEVWSVEKPTKHISIKGAHLDGVNGAAFLDNNTVVTAGQDASVKTWSLTY
ncbi:WD40-repeat-containing domain protein [Zopfochytrium polystomum]|nr:WD40-repeat-containing domain protein [Zopfochytrium polystomum]